VEEHEVNSDKKQSEKKHRRFENDDILFSIKMIFACHDAQRGCITDVGGFNAGQARIVKPHIDLMLKLK
jgi:hypothetical protein